MMLKLSALAFLLLLTKPQRARSQGTELQQLLLNVEKLSQLKSLLNDMYTGYQVLDKGYSAIKDISKGNFSLHETFLNGLLAVSPVVRKYRHVADIIGIEADILKEVQQASRKFRGKGTFGAAEIQYLGQVYSGLSRESLQNLDELSMVITDSKLRMSDDERLTAIDRIYGEMQDKLTFLRSFNGRAALLHLQRQQAKNELSDIQQLYRKN